MGGNDMDLSKPHPDFPRWSRASLYDIITGMFLDCGNDDETARSFSQQLGKQVQSSVVHGIRKEAALAAEAQADPQARRKWIYRYLNLTVNNLVKEYMFLTGERNFIKAKRELAAEIVALSQVNDAGRLWIAVNDALGRNNIDMELIQQLAAYDERARKLEKMISGYYAARWVITVDAAFAQVAEAVQSFYLGHADRDMAKAVRFAANLLHYEEGAITAEDVELLQEHHKFQDAAPESTSFTQRIMLAADVVAQAPSLLERVLANDSVELSVLEIYQLTSLVKSGTLLDPGKLAALNTFARRHIGHHDVRQQLGDMTPDDGELRALKPLETATGELLDFTRADRLYAPREIDRAERAGTPLASLQAELDELNRLASFELAVRQLVTWRRAKRAVAFPDDRYLKKRFRQGMP